MGVPGWFCFLPYCSLLLLKISESLVCSFAVSHLATYGLELELFVLLILVINVEECILHCNEQMKISLMVVTIL